MSKLIDLLRALGKDGELADAYAKDPDAVLNQFELTDEERQAMLDGDLDKIRALTGQDNVHTTHKTIKIRD